MATVAQLMEAISVVTMVEKKTVNTYARALIDADLLPISKGRALAHVSPEHCANLLLAVALQLKAKVTPDMIKIYNRLEAKAKSGTVTVKDCMYDLFGAASGGGETIGTRWRDVEVLVYENRFGFDLHLPKQAGLLEFRLPAHMNLSHTSKVWLEPNMFFARSATIKFSAFIFICQVMSAYQFDEASEQGKECIERIEALLQA
ncbi:hypothetical protein ACLBWZ_14340 [Brucellaceae bacterium C25G]